MPQYDSKLGQRVADHLVSQNVETPCTPGLLSEGPSLSVIRHAQQTILDAMGMNLSNESLQDTPKRIAKMYCEEIFTGLDYSQFPACSTFPNDMNANELIICKDAEVLSVCEHHFVPFVGKCHIGYIPKIELLGLSKFYRVVDFFSRRPQVQERLTLQIYHALQYILDTDDIAVTIKAEHMCVRLRGVKQQSETITSKIGGKFFDKQPLREEFMSLVR